MPAKGKVKLSIQTIFCIIPILDMYAAYRIKKLRKYLAIMILVIIVPVTIASSVFLPTNDSGLEGFTNLLIFYYGVDDNQFIFSVGTQIGTILFAIFLIRRWSKQWNLRLD
jgi:formate hydrogenlyase subunit 3/multisubunit Na+/H+ antiporter MnhD subunit